MVISITDRRYLQTKKRIHILLYSRKKPGPRPESHSFCSFGGRLLKRMPKQAGGRHFSFLKTFLPVNGSFWCQHSFCLTSSDNFRWFPRAPFTVWNQSPFHYCPFFSFRFFFCLCYLTICTARCLNRSLPL